MSTTDMAGDLTTGGRCSSPGKLRRSCNIRICRSAKPSPEITVAGQESAGSPPIVGILHCSKTASRFCPSPSASRDQDRDFTAIDAPLDVLVSAALIGFDGDGTTRTAGRRRRYFDMDGGGCEVFRSLVGEEEGSDRGKIGS
ncbi:hypothetical protein TIFTF001_031172 [Ficus carica]|uniref:Uncharacterized protein n=1 Tax=Ficus carica TaxID=3494 RepID=A0AA88J3U5_FICCA|nr:hypothetical protein TIFTF001_031172 [Ficus carica]